MKILEYIFVGIAGGIMNVGASIPSDASSVTWAHAVNNKKKLEEALAGPVQFLEADVSLGNVTGPNPEFLVPIMAHPPEKTSDISLAEWIRTVISARTNVGVKLDFKFIEVVEKSLKILSGHKDNIKFPLWLNADILPGPVDSTTIPVNHTQFLSLCKYYYFEATISVGWTTNYQGTEGSYSWNNVRDMAEALQCSEANAIITFPVRAVFVGASLSQLKWLLEDFPNSTLTVWSGFIDTVRVDDLLQLRSQTDFSKVYYDLPSPLNEEFQDMKNSTQPIVEVSGFKDHPYSLFGIDESCSDKTSITHSTIMLSGKSKGIIFHEIFRRRNLVHMNGKITFLTNSDSPAETSFLLVISKASAFPQDPHSTFNISIPEGTDVSEVIRNSIIFSHKFSNDMLDQQFQLHLSKNNRSLSIEHKVGTIPYNINYDEDVIISIISGDGISIIHDGEFTATEGSNAVSVSANLFLSITLFVFYVYYY